MKKRLLSFVMVFVIALGAVTAAGALSFPDVDAGEDYADAVNCVSDMEIMVGDSGGKFNPEKTVSRAEMAVIICKLMGETENLKSGAKFSDVPQSHWANAYIIKAVELGAVSGYGNGKFGPADSLTYEQAVTMIIQALGQGDAAQKAGGYPNGFISVANEKGYLEGIATKIGDPMTRGQTAVLCYNVILGGNGQ